MDKIYSLIMDDKLTWEHMIIDVVREEGINPWNINVSKLTSGYISRIREMKNLNFRFSGKVLLIASILLRLKSSEFVFVEDKEEEIIERTALLDGVEIDYSELDINVPLPKTRKVTLQELMSALDAALVVKDRKEHRRQKLKELKKREEFKLKFKDINIGDKISSLFLKIKQSLSQLKIKKILFSKLIPSKSREDIVWTFLPLLHLSNKSKVSLTQEEVFGDISVELLEGDLN
ncbi:MAG: segregation/condensation protein A [Nanoarchaeota archaeon]|nr:segregation/condensation protein A [Nanoarchaeota archaeon]